ncbi:MAG TPA: hypothetical protein VGO11_12390 [Chthoniobacteraceae bacterium]|nr:hypothetical protein [Chthoniobacteraceae bacterium]
MNYPDAFLCRCGYEFADGEDLAPGAEVAAITPSTLRAIQFNALTITALVGVIESSVFGRAYLDSILSGVRFGDFLAMAGIFVAPMAVTFGAVHLLGRMVASRETGVGMKIVAMILFGVGAVLVAAGIFVAGCAASFHIGG